MPKIWKSKCALSTQMQTHSLLFSVFHKKTPKLETQNWLNKARCNWDLFKVGKGGMKSRPRALYSNIYAILTLQTNYLDTNNSSNVLTFSTAAPQPEIDGFSLPAPNPHLHFCQWQHSNMHTTDHRTRTHHLQRNCHNVKGTQRQRGLPEPVQRLQGVAAAAQQKDWRDRGRKRGAQVSMEETI